MSETLTDTGHFEMGLRLEIDRQKHDGLCAGREWAEWAERLLADAAETERLRAENARLRAALEEIADGDHGEYCGLRNQMLVAGGKTECYADCPKRVAREALAPAPKEDDGE